MALFRNRYRVESTRLRGWDYAQPGLYFVTICTRDKYPWFGQVLDGNLRLSAVGELALQCWRQLPAQFGHVALDAHVVMPDHIHAILALGTVSAREIHPPSARNSSGEAVGTPTMSSISPLPGSLPVVIRSYKGGVTRRARNELQLGFAWQPRYYDHIIRDGAELDRIRAYIADNPRNWQRDHALDHDGDAPWEAC